MAQEGPKVETLGASEARARFGQLLNQVFRREKRVVVEKNGIPVAALVSAEDLDRLERRERERMEHFKVLDEIRARNAQYHPGEVEADVADELAAARDEARASVEQRV